MRVGLTGGIGTGKSKVAQLLAQLGAAVISADAIAREVVESGRPAYRRVVEHFGREFVSPDGALDRPALARKVFADPEARKMLESIIHPAVREETARRIAAIARQAEPPPAVVVEIPLLFEAGRQRDFDEVWVVAASEDTAVERAARRDDVTPDEIRARMRAQWPLAEKVRRADVVIDNDGAWEDTASQVRSAWSALVRRAAQRGCRGADAGPGGDP